MTLGSHQTAVGKSQVHLTPRWILDALGLFDLDPCAATVRPWDCATINYIEAQDGLSLPWHGRVWLNPPFDRYVAPKFMGRLAVHGNGIALVHARTETSWFKPIWEAADTVLFLDRRLAFLRPDGSEQPSDSGAPPVLAAFGRENAQRLATSGISGALVTGWKTISNDPQLSILDVA